MVTTQEVSKKFADELAVTLLNPRGRVSDTLFILILYLFIDETFSDFGLVSRRKNKSQK